MHPIMYKGYPLLFNLTPGTKILLLVAIIWTLIWKGVALWKAARNGHKAWYIILLIVNTVGILEIIYIFGVNRKKPQMQQPMM